MRNVTSGRLARISDCRLDLLSNEIDIAGMAMGQVEGLVGEHIEYFQLMLGDESTPAQVLALIRKDLAARGGGAS